MDKRRKRQMGAVILFVLTISLLLADLAIRNRSAKTGAETGVGPAAQALAAAVVNDPAPAPMAATLTNAPEERAKPVAPARKEHNGVAPVASADQPEPDPTAPAESAAPSATAQQELAPPGDAGADGPAQAPPAVVALAPPPVVDSTGLVSARFRDAVGPTYRLLSVNCSIDGVVVHSGKPARGMMFDRRLPPGNHTITIAAEYQGEGGGVISYLEDYHFRGHARRAFLIQPGTTTHIQVSAYERGGPTVAYEERLGLAVDIR